MRKRGGERPTASGRERERERVRERDQTKHIVLIHLSLDSHEHDLINAGGVNIVMQRDACSSNAEGMLFVSV